MREIKNQEKPGNRKQETKENDFPHFSIPQFILIFTSCFCLGLYPSRAITKTPNLAPTTQSAILNPGMIGAEVQLLQVQLKALGYYNGLLDGQYGPSTQNALVQFQKAQSLKRQDGIADLKTQTLLKTALSGQTKCTNTPVPTPPVNSQSQPSKLSFIWWSLLGLGILGNVGLAIYLIRRFGKVKYSAISEDQKLLSASESGNQKLLSSSDQDHHKLFLNPVQTPTLPTSIELLQPETSAIVSQMNIFDELIKDLRGDDPTQRRKAIWNLGQKGDSRAIQPLVDLMIDADSQQHGLILSALSEIGTRTLKPMSRALAISMQNENAQVRKNAIRDLVKIYDMMGQMSQVLRHALEDTDPEVQATARYAFTKMNRFNKIAEQNIFMDMNAEEPNG